MTNTIPPVLQSQAKDHTLHYRARCWRITLNTLSNKVFRFTDHSENLVLFDNAEYKAVDGADASANRRKDGVKPGNRDIRGFITDSDITHKDLQAGLYDNAEVIEYLIDTRMPFVGAFEALRYFIRSVEFDGVNWQADIHGMTRMLEEPTGDIWGKRCRSELFAQGLGKCNLEPTPFIDTTNVSLVIEPRYQFRFNVTNSFFNFANVAEDGYVEFHTGSLAGLRAHIKDYDISNLPHAEIVLSKRVPYDIVLGDTITVYPGCDKQIDGHCNFRYNNTVNHQGEPLIPGGDLARKGLPIRSL